jgi:hypothetical protein
VDHDLGSLFYALGDCAAALPQFQRSLAILERLVGPESEKIVEDLGAVASARHHLGDLRAVHEALSRASQIARDKLGPRNVDALQILYSLGAVLVDEGQFAAAREHCGFAQYHLEALLGADDERTRGPGQCEAVAAGGPERMEVRRPRRAGAPAEVAARCRPVARRLDQDL